MAKIRSCDQNGALSLDEMELNLFVNASACKIFLLEFPILGLEFPKMGQLLPWCTIIGNSVEFPIMGHCEISCPIFGNSNSNIGNSSKKLGDRMRRHIGK